jgi:hypothetical protein
VALVIFNNFLLVPSPLPFRKISEEWPNFDPRFFARTKHRLLLQPPCSVDFVMMFVLDLRGLVAQFELRFVAAVPR